MSGSLRGGDGVGSGGCGSSGLWGERSDGVWGEAVRCLPAYASGFSRLGASWFSAEAGGACFSVAARLYGGKNDMRQKQEERKTVK